ncbi:XdhC family protein [Aliikangiella marina]|uniref:XdhC family protein n=1 Tax=Aliikangiella marina TaxID=1712262 RepID=A0A545T6V7_9GAMM|nr:XdhC family protein [Aliikangiella marina]TQV72956.1 XdhC family protein [Aliikangiella marina]
MLNLFSALETFQVDQDYVLATVIQTQGSTYRKAGTLMLLDSALNYFGLISGGCLEGDIQEHTKAVLKEKSDKLIHYDMRGEEDLIWGMGLGCDGAIDLLLKYLPANEGHFQFFDILKSIQQGTQHVLSLSLSPPFEFSFNRIHPDNTNQTSVKLTDSTIEIPLKPPLRILVCGASPDVPPVAGLAKQLGWQTTIIDHRPDFIQPGNFPMADKVTLVKRNQWDNFDLTNFDAAIIMTHQFERDEEYLKRLLTTDLNYIGLLGPVARRDKLLANIGTTFANHEGRVFGPVGLDIGADSPETIALAIISEIQAVKAQKSVGFCYQDENR